MGSLPMSCSRRACWAGEVRAAAVAAHAHVVLGQAGGQGGGAGLSRTPPDHGHQAGDEGQEPFHPCTVPGPRNAVHAAGLPPVPGGSCCCAGWLTSPDGAAAVTISSPAVAHWPGLTHGRPVRARVATAP